MKNKKNKEEQTVASELFIPDLSAEYIERFKKLITLLGKKLSINRVNIILSEIESINITDANMEFDVEKLRYAASLNVLKDLSQQGWIFDIADEKLVLRMENDNLDDKKYIRYRMSAERNAQFKTPSIKRFINKMEKTRVFNGKSISIRNLIGDVEYLKTAIEKSELICKPYIQLVTNERDLYTGMPLSEIWRYFRYTWSIPYKSMPGRNLFYLVRDELQPCHPIIGIFALGNSVLNLTVRDDDIGWTIDAIKKRMSRRYSITHCDQIVSDTDGGKIKVKISKPEETDKEYLNRVEEYANKMYPLLEQSIELAISDIYVKDLHYFRQTKYPKQEYIDSLITLSEKLSIKAINNKNNEKDPVWEEETRSNLFKKKRANELAKLLSAKLIFTEVQEKTNVNKLNELLSNEKGRKAINTALIANRKRKIGSNMMDIIVCGAIPPYNELLGGKLISILACSPTVIRDYTNKYKNQVSEIASRMKGKKVVRDSHLVYLGTTSLYSIGSSQYNRIKVPLESGNTLEYKKMGITEGFGTVYFSSNTTSLFSRILELQDGGKKINHVFGEGTSPRFRMISRGLKTIGIRADAFLKHYSPRIVYSIDLAKNTKEFLLGFTEEIDYGFNLNNSDEVEKKTQELIDYWYERWLIMRLTSVDIIKKLDEFNVNEVLLSKIC